MSIKKIILLFAVVFISTRSLGQFFLGMKISEVYEMIQADSKNEIFQEGVIKEEFVLMWQNKDSKVMYSLTFKKNGFNSKRVIDLSYKYIFTPSTLDDVYATAKLYNYQFKRIDGRHWVYNDKGKSVYIDYIINPDKSYYFYVHY